MATNNPGSGLRALKHASIFMGAIISLWSAAAVFSGLASVNWQVSELLRQYLVTIGVMQEFHTLSDFYTHIKGVEYIICAAFLCLFPVFYSYVNRDTQEAGAAS